jgi:hypothetical protein
MVLKDNIMQTFRDGISFIYYLIGAVAFVLVFIRLLYGWFRDFENGQRFTTDMAKVHLPYIYNSLNKIGDALGVELDHNPPVNFSDLPRP